MDGWMNGLLDGDDDEDDNDDNDGHDDMCVSSNAIRLSRLYTAYPGVPRHTQLFIPARSGGCGLCLQHTAYWTACADFICCPH